MKEGLRVKKGGKVDYIRWDMKKKSPGYVVTDVTDQAHRYLFEPVTFDDDVTLRDLFLIINRNIDFYNDLLRNWCAEIVAEGLSEREKSKCNEDIEYLELYWQLEKDQDADGISLSGYIFPDFHGWGDWDDSTKGGISLGLTPVYEFVDVPIRLRSHLTLIEPCTTGIPPEVNEFKDATYALGQVLHGIIWELSFYGGPKQRCEMRKELIDQVEEIKQRNSNENA
jgi:hypothetical protein